MKRKFSKMWKSSSQPRKQRKYRAKAPLHIIGEFMNVNLAKPLRAKYGRNERLRKGDKIKVMRGKFAKKEGKVSSISLKFGKVYVEGISMKKKDGSNVNVPLKPSKLQITELNLEDKRRFKRLGKSVEKKEIKLKDKSKEKNKEVQK